MPKTETRLKQKLEEQNMTSAQLAEVLHIAPSTVTGWVKGERDIYPALIGQVCGVLACTEEEIVGKVEKKTMTKKKETEPVDEQLTLNMKIKETDVQPVATETDTAKEIVPVKEEKQPKKVQKAKAEAKPVAEVSAKEEKKTAKTEKAEPAKVKTADKVVDTKPVKTTAAKKVTKQIGELPGDIEWLMTNFDFREKAKAIKTKDDIDEWCGAFSKHIDYLMEGLTSVAFGYIDSVTETNPRINKLLSLAGEASDKDLDMAIALLERLNVTK